MKMEKWREQKRKKEDQNGKMERTKEKKEDQNGENKRKENI